MKIFKTKWAVKDHMHVVFGFQTTIDVLGMIILSSCNKWNLRYFQQIMISWWKNNFTYLQSDPTWVCFSISKKKSQKVVSVQSQKGTTQEAVTQHLQIKLLHVLGYWVFWHYLRLGIVNFVNGIRSKVSHSPMTLLSYGGFFLSLFSSQSICCWQGRDRNEIKKDCVKYEKCCSPKS